MTNDSKKDDANPIREMKIDSLAEYINKVEKISARYGNFWYRGHADATWQLAPSIFRNLISKGVTDEREKNLREIEVTTNIDFQHQVKAREKNFPHDNDQVGQLVVARHHGLLSRLLDWSESPLTALFFAVEEDISGHEPDASCVWMILPDKLNENQWESKIIDYSHAPVPKAIARCAFNSTVTLEFALKEMEREYLKEMEREYLKEMEREREVEIEKPGIVAAFIPQHTILRHMVQKAHFTIHHTPKAMDKLPGALKFLVKIIIPSGKRKEILKELRWAGISRDLLFPDLDNLAKHLNAEIERVIERLFKDADA